MFFCDTKLVAYFHAERAAAQMRSRYPWAYPSEENSRSNSRFLDYEDHSGMRMIFLLGMTL
ncbi:MAG: hypothetical protein DMG92_12160 [Acidobacteria bacterium]|nr:MAG: hypothetical protein DMG92_12160 [Acidobacteriota bacterium]